VVGNTFEERFLKKLATMPGGLGQPVSNKALRDALGWSETSYDNTKKRLIKSKRIKAVRGGRGGSVKLVESPVAPPEPKPLKLFVSYSHADKNIKDRLIKHLRPLERLELIECWHDRELKAGALWDAEIDKNLELSDIILFIVSIDFINSEYCYDKELAAALAKHSDKKIIVPVIVHHCLWKLSPLEKYQALPTGGKTIASWNDQDEALADVAEGIHDLVLQLRNRGVA
jgi:hypothetical protein